VIEEAQARGRGGELGRVDVAVDPEGGFVAGLARGGVRGRDQPDVAPLVAPAEARNREEVGPAAGEAVQDLGELGIAVEPVEALDL